MSSKNDITGDEIKSKVTSQSYRDNWEQIFGRGKERFIEKAVEKGVDEFLEQHEEIPPKE